MNTLLCIAVAVVAFFAIVRALLLWSDYWFDRWGKGKDDDDVNNL